MAMAGLVFLDVFSFNMVLFTGSGKLRGKSASHLDWLKGKARGKMEKRFVKSLAPLKIKFGSNFVDELTALVIQDFCSVQIMNCLILV